MYSASTSDSAVAIVCAVSGSSARAFTVKITDVASASALTAEASSDADMPSSGTFSATRRMTSSWSARSAYDVIRVVTR